MVNRVPTPIIKCHRAVFFLFIQACKNVRWQFSLALSLFTLASFYHANQCGDGKQVWGKPHCVNTNAARMWFLTLHILNIKFMLNFVGVYYTKLMCQFYCTSSRQLTQWRLRLKRFIYNLLIVTYDIYTYFSSDVGHLWIIASFELLMLIEHSNRIRVNDSE